MDEFGEQKQRSLILPVRFWRWRDSVIPSGQAFLKGARLYDYDGYLPYYWSNTSICFYALTNNTWTDFPHTANYLAYANTSDNETFWWWPKYQNGTLFLKIVSESLYTCNNMAKNAHAYISMRVTLF